jgi:hypothetical protein
MKLKIMAISFRTVRTGVSLLAAWISAVGDCSNLSVLQRGHDLPDCEEINFVDPSRASSSTILDGIRLNFNQLRILRQKLFTGMKQPDTKIDIQLHCLLSDLQDPFFRAFSICGVISIMW